MCTTTNLVPKTIFSFINESNELEVWNLYSDGAEISYTFNIKLCSYRPLHISLDEAKRLIQHEYSTNIDDIVVTDINGNRYYVQLCQITYGKND